MFLKRSWKYVRLGLYSLAVGRWLKSFSVQMAFHTKCCFWKILSCISIWLNPFAKSSVVAAFPKCHQCLVLGYFVEFSVIYNKSAFRFVTGIHLFGTIQTGTEWLGLTIPLSSISSICFFTRFYAHICIGMFLLQWEYYSWSLQWEYYSWFVFNGVCKC